MHLLQQLHADVLSCTIPDSAKALVKRFEPLTVGMRLKAPILLSGARLFRIRRMNNIPLNIAEVGAPPTGVAPIGRVNDKGQSVLYLADSPDTAFAEARATTGKYCLSEWRIQPPKVVLANGGIPEYLLRAHFSNDFDKPSNLIGGVEDKELLDFFHTIFTIQVFKETQLYCWSIACGLANGFASICGRTGVEIVNGNTMLSGRYPFSGIAYPSTRQEKKSINFAFNDLGMSYVQLDNIQWIERHADGAFSGINFASSWIETGEIAWQGRPARYQLLPGMSARITKVGTTVWKYEQDNGDIPFFV